MSAIDDRFTSFSRRETLIFAVLLAVAVALWVRPLRSSLWLDETGTYWIVKNGFHSVLNRSLTFQGQSPLYFLLLSGWVRIFGSSELAMRVPSLLATGGATFFLYRIGARLFDRTTGLIAAITFASAGQVAFSAADARPYALALLGVAASTSVLLRWEKTQKRSDEVTYVLLVAMTLYAHYVFGLVFLAHLAFVSVPGEKAIRFSRLLRAWLLSAVIVSPLAGQLVALWRRGGSLSWPGEPHWNSFVLALLIPGLVAGAAFALASFNRRSGFAQPSPRRRDLILVLAMAIVPIIVTFVVSELTGVKVFHPRYYMASVPGLALVIAWAAGSIRLPFMRIVLAGALVFAALVSNSPSHTHEQWRDAVAAANLLAPDAGTPVLVNTGYIEARSLSWVTDSSRRGFLTAPVSYYALSGRLVLIPYGATPDLLEYAAGQAERAAAGSRRVVLLTNYIDPYREPIARRLPGYSSRVAGVFGTLLLISFDRT